MQNRVSIWRETLKGEPIHMSVHLYDQDYKRLQEIVETEHLPSTEAYDRMRSVKAVKDS